MTNGTRKRARLDNGSTLKAGDFVSFTFNDQRVIACLKPHAHGLYSSEGIMNIGYKPFIATADGRIALGIENLQKLDKDQVVMLLANTMLLPGNAHLARRAKELFDG